MLSPLSLVSVAGLPHRPVLRDTFGLVLVGPGGLDNTFRSSKDARHGWLGTRLDREASGSHWLSLKRPGGYACLASQPFSNPILQCLLGVRHCAQIDQCSRRPAHQGYIVTE